MAPPKALAIALALAVTLALGLTACGGSNLLSGTTANEITSNLEQVQELVADGNCATAEEAVDKVTAQVDGLEGVNSELKEALSDAATHLRDVVSTCEEVGEEESTVAPAESEEPEEENEKAEREEKPAKPKPEEGETAPTESEGQEEEGETKPTEPEEPPSGGVSPSTPAGEGS